MKRDRFVRTMKLRDEDRLRLRHHILKKLAANGAYTNGHLLFERLQEGVESHLRGAIKDVLKELLEEELVRRYGKTKHGVAYQMNITKLARIQESLSSRASRTR